MGIDNLSIVSESKTCNLVIENAVRLVYSYIRHKYAIMDTHALIKELKIISKMDCVIQEDCAFCDFNYEEIQEKLSKLNEKESFRKRKGVYYTPPDVVKFILTNSIKAAYGKLNESNISDMDLNNIPYRSFCLKKTIFDPTCGSGEFLLYALKIKFELLKQHTQSVSKKMIDEMVSTIYGNDVNAESIIISKLRIFLYVVETYGVDSCIGLGIIMNRSFSTYDFVAYGRQSELKYNIIVGNPPYVEDSKSGLSHDERYGNIYANVLINAAKCLEKNGTIGFVIPLSYVSTPRMKKLREKLKILVPEQYLLSFADRPDCLFEAVHQKLCILIGKNRQSPNCVYTGNYLYWYKDERNKLFQNLSIIKNGFCTSDFIPKLGNNLDVSIYEKISDKSNMQSIYEASRSGDKSVYLNRRETFWMKAYRTYIDDPEYKIFSFETTQDADFCYCIINSSLFWWYWICVSDCWHVSKSLNGFTMPYGVDTSRASELANNLFNKLEETKIYVGTKQTEYEYKHRECLIEIHEIDDYINNVYGLTAEESQYIKKFALKYRTSGGIATDGSN